MERVYLDNNATTPVDPEVVEAMTPFFGEVFGNPSSQHGMGVEAQRALTDARTIVAQVLGVGDREIIFTSGATESVNMALKGVAKANKRMGNHIVTSSIEHECVLETCRELEEDGYIVQYIKPDKYGWINPQKVIDAVRDDTVMVAIMHVNNELGTINDIEEIAREVKTNWKDVYVFADGAQAFGKLTVNLNNIDLYSFSAHKMHGPKGVGGLYVKEDTKIKPLIIGGGQELKLRSGTENVPGIMGLRRAVEIAYECVEEHREYIRTLRDVFLNELDGLEYVINSPKEALENTLNLSLPGCRAEHIMHLLEEQNIYVSTGAACSTNQKIKSHVLEGIDAPLEIKESALRISFSRMNTEEEVRRAGRVLREIRENI